MSSVREIALLKAQQRTEARALAAQLPRETVAQRSLRARQRTIERSALGDWFPGVEWEIVAYTSGDKDGDTDGHSCVVHPVGDPDLTLLLHQPLAVDGTIWTGPQIRAVRYAQRGRQGVWEGPIVQDPADIGDWLAAHTPSTSDIGDDLLQAG